MDRSTASGRHPVYSTLPEGSAFHPASGLLRPPVTRWMLQRTVAAGARGQSCGYVLLRVGIESVENRDYGPGTSEELLRFFGEEARTSLRAADAAGHLADEEILLFLPGEAQAGAETVAARLLNRLDGASLSASRTVRAWTLPFEYTSDATTAEALLEAARRELGANRGSSASTGERAE